MYRNDMYDYLKEHAYISKNKKSNYQFELSEERAECIANKFNSLVIDLYQNQWLGRIQDLEQENQELKKQLSNSHQIEVQQKEFIKWLKKEIKTTQDRLNKYNEKVKNREETDIEYYESIIDERIFDVYEKVLSKYKEIVGYKE